MWPAQLLIPLCCDCRETKVCEWIERMSYIATRQPEIQFPEAVTYGEKTMKTKILVAYATRAGSTAQIADKIGQVLAAQGVAVDVMPLKNVSIINSYHAVVLGSAVRIGGWLPEAVKFVEKNKDELSQMPTAFFAVHLLNLGNDEASRQARLAYLDSVRKLVKPNQEAFFAGVGDWKRVSFLEGLMGKMVKAPEADLRDWEAIRSWAEALGKDGFAGARL